MFRIVRLEIFLVILFIVITFFNIAVKTSSITMTMNSSIVIAEYSSEPTTESTTVSTIENTIMPITVNTIMSTTRSTIMPTTVSTTVTTTESTTFTATANITVPITENTTVPTQENTTVHTIESATVPTTKRTIMQTTESTIMLTTESTIMPTMGSTIMPTIENNIMPTTESTIMPTTENTIMPTTESTIMPTIGSTSMPTTKSTIMPTVGNNIMSTTESTTVSTTESTTVSITESTTVPTTENTTVPTTENTTVPTTGITTVPITDVHAPRAGSTVMPTTVSTTVTTTESTTFTATANITVQITENTTVPTQENTTVHTMESATVPTTKSTIMQTTESTIMLTTESTIMPTMGSTIMPTTESTIMPTIENNIIPTTESTIMPTTENTIMPTTESTIMPTIGSTIMPTTKSTIMPTVGNNIMPTTESTTVSITESTTVSITESTTVPTTENTTVPTTENTTVPTTGITTVPITDVRAPRTGSTVMPTTGSTIMPTTESTIMPTTETTIMSTIGSTVMPTTKSTIMPTIGSTTVLTTESTTVPTTEITTVPTTESIIVPTTRNIIIPTTVSTNVPTTQSNTVRTIESSTVSTTQTNTVPTPESPTVSTTESTTVPTTDSSSVSTTESTTVPTTNPPPPGHPANVSVVGVTSSSIEISWTAPENVGGGITNYVIRYMSIVDDNNDTKHCNNSVVRIEQLNTTQNNVTTIFLENLQAWTLHQINVSANSSYGEGPAAVITSRTNESVPEQPKSVDIGNVSSTSVTLYWEEPCKPNGIITGYIVRYTTNTSTANLNCSVEEQNMTINVGGNITFDRNITGLYPWTTYMFCIAAQTTSGNSAEICKEQQTLQDLPGAINNLTVVNVTSRSIEICWKEPCPPNGNITGYILNVNVSDGIQMNTTETKELCQVFENLLPYKNYSFDVTAKTKDEEGVSQSISVETDTEVPLKPKDVRCFVMNSTAIEVSWQKGEYKTGPTSYSVSAIDNENNASKYNCSTNGFQQTTCIITSLDEYWNYTTEVTASTDKGSSISDTCFNQTKQDAPGYVEFFSVSQIDDLRGPRQVRIIWRPPTEREQNGIITFYNISWTPEGGQVNSTHVTSDLRNLTVEVKSNIQYTFAIHAVTIMPGRGNKSELFIQPRVPNKPRENASYPLIQQSTTTLEEPRRQIAVTLLPKKVLCGDTNGEPNHWGVIVSSDEEAETDEPYSGSRTTYTKTPKYNKTWHLAFKQRPVSPYRVTEQSWMPKSCSGKNAKTVTDSVFVVGTDSVCSASDGHCNGYLDPGQLYRVKVFWCTDTACTETEYSLPIATAREDKEPTQNLSVIIGSVAGSALAFIIIGIVSIYIWRRQLACFMKRKTNAEDGEDNVTFVAENLEDKRKQRPIRLSDFHAHFETLSEKSNPLFSQAYKELSAFSPKFSTSDAELEETRMKNRYTNILPFNKTRVKIVGADDEPGSDYINANYIAGFSSGREYIATQGPIPSTINDFWRMIWEQNASIIVMLTQCIERGRKKCEKYWPNDINESVFYGDIVVNMESESHLPDFILRTFVLRLGDFERRVRHYYYLIWPDMGVPDSTDYMLRFVDTVRRDIRPDMIGPIVVHCSAGVGRTGTYIMLDTIIKKIQSGEDSVDIFGDVLNLRNCRTNMVQTEVQFVYIHECIRDYLMPVAENLNEDNLIYENVSTL